MILTSPSSATGRRLDLALTVGLDQFERVEIACLVHTAEA